MHTALLSNYYFITYLAQALLGPSVLSTIIGRWSPVDSAGNSYLEQGIGYFLSPPRNLWELVTDPVHTVFYVTVVLFFFSFISRIWIEVNGTSPRDVAKQL